MRIINYFVKISFPFIIRNSINRMAAVSKRCIKLPMSYIKKPNIQNPKRIKATT
jgi:hypothetical protein